MTEPQQTPEPSSQAGDAQQSSQAPPWGDDFDPERAWNTIQKLREREKELEKQPRLTDEQRKQLDDAEKERRKRQSDAERLTEELTKTQSEVQKWRTATVTSRIEALAAAADFAFPSDAVDKLKPERYLGDDGSIDEKAIRGDLAKLLEQRPNFRRQSDPRVPAPNPAQGRTGQPAVTAAEHMNQLIRSARV